LRQSERSEDDGAVISQCADALAHRGAGGDDVINQHHQRSFDINAPPHDDMPADPASALRRAPHLHGFASYAAHR
jgi:CRISPR/Cas system CMR subunit Cmr6 (Cas7 group RAMP superfamily)